MLSKRLRAAHRKRESLVAVALRQAAHDRVFVLDGEGRVDFPGSAGLRLEVVGEEAFGSHCSSDSCCRLGAFEPHDQVGEAELAGLFSSIEGRRVVDVDEFQCRTRLEGDRPRLPCSTRAKPRCV